MSWIDHALDEIEALRAAGLHREIRDLDAIGPRGRLDDGRLVISFASNDYLGLSHHPRVLAAAHAALDRWGAGATAARLIVGSRPVHSALEVDLADWKAADRALLFPSGFAANLGALSALAGPGVTICSDELNHASIIDGCRASRARVVIYPHRDLPALERALKVGARAIVVTERVFSMDGDEAPLNEIAQLCTRHDALLVIDEAHAVLAQDAAALPATTLRIGTLSKFLGAVGGFVAGPDELVDLILNRARSFIYTTAGSPGDAAAAQAALAILRSNEGEHLQARLRANIAHMKSHHQSPIVPVMVGDEGTAATLARALLEKRLLVPAIRPPTVPPGTARLRVTLSADHRPEDVAALKVALAELQVPVVA